MIAITINITNKMAEIRALGASTRRRLALAGTLPLWKVADGQGRERSRLPFISWGSTMLTPPTPALLDLARRWSASLASPELWPVILAHGKAASQLQEQFAGTPRERSGLYYQKRHLKCLWATLRVVCDRAGEGALEAAGLPPVAPVAAWVLMYALCGHAPKEWPQERWMEVVWGLCSKEDINAQR